MFGKQFLKVLFLGAVVLVAGCSDGIQQGYYDAKARYKEKRARWSPVYLPSRASRVRDGGVEWTQLTYVAAFKPGSSKLTPSASAGLSRLGSRYGGRGTKVTVLLDYPGNAKARKLVEKRRRAISIALAQRGLSASNVRAVPGAKHRNSAVVLMGVRRAVVASCSEWKTAIAGSLPRADEWRYGCVTRSSLRAHIDNPADLVGGRPLGGFDGVTAAKTITDYRAGKLDKLPDSEGTQGGSSQ